MSDPPIETMPSLPSPLPGLTLIVATTPSLAIGYHGTFPWFPLKGDLAFFARITKRPPPSHPTQRTSSVPARNGSSQNTTVNAVIMGRKTWDSIPLKNRPLKERINVVVSRQTGEWDGKEGRFLMRVGSIEEGLRRLQLLDSTLNGDDASAGDDSHQDQISLGRVFIIGGAEIYATALKMDCCERILWTKMEKEWKGDVWFPIEKETGEEQRGEWKRKSDEELDEWCGEEGVGQRKEMGGLAFRVEMWERERRGDEAMPDSG